MLCDVSSVKQLRTRVMKLKDDHDRIYHLTRTEGVPTINWGNIMDEKLVGRKPGWWDGSFTCDFGVKDLTKIKGQNLSLRVPIQDNLNNKGFGQDLPSVENEVEEHNIFHSEVEALAPHISTSGDKVTAGSASQASVSISISISMSADKRPLSPGIRQQPPDEVQQAAGTPPTCTRLCPL